MIRILNDSKNPAFSLAAEEYLLERKTGEEFLMLWQNRPSVIIGKFQNPFLELSPGLCMRNNIGVYRRNSGGGTVYHDLGNLNYTVVADRGEGSPEYERFLAPVIAFLATLGIEAEIRDTSAIFANGVKISGNAQSVSGGRIMHHGTLLFDSVLGELNTFTGRERDGVSSRSIRSNPSEVGNIRPMLREDMTFGMFRDSLGKYLTNETVSFSGEEMSTIETLAAEKYRTWEWTYGRTTAFTLENGDLRITSKHGVIESSSIYGDVLAGKRLEFYELRDSLLPSLGEEETKKILSLIFG